MQLVSMRDLLEKRQGQDDVEDHMQKLLVSSRKVLLGPLGLDPEFVADLHMTPGHVLALHVQSCSGAGLRAQGLAFVHFSCPAIFFLQ